MAFDDIKEQTDNIAGDAQENMSDIADDTGQKIDDLMDDADDMGNLGGEKRSPTEDLDENNVL